MTVLVRPAHAGQYAAIGELTFTAYATGGFVTESDGYAAHLRDAGARAGGAELYVADVGGSLAGTVTFCPEGSAYRELAGPGEGEFRMLAVASEARRQGVAAALVGACEERSRELGYHAIVLCSMRSQTDAHRVYARLGFRRVPDLDWSPVPGVELLGFRLDL
ncbi:MAG: GNAT family N-acetyltransferase [Nocardioidaceae bacterium]